MLKAFETWFAHLHGAVFQYVVQPVLFHGGWMVYAEPGIRSVAYGAPGHR